MDKWLIDAEGSKATFAIRLLFKHLHGVFTGITGSALLDPADIPRSSVEAVIDASSATADDPVWNAQLRGQHFLDVERFPNITFRSSAIEQLEGSRVCIHGALTIRGVTCDETLEAEYSAPEEARDQDRLTMQLRATVSLDREDYGITFRANEGISLLLGKEITITLDITLLSAFAASEHQVRA